MKHPKQRLKEIEETAKVFTLTSSTESLFQGEHTGITETLEWLEEVLDELNCIDNDFEYAKGYNSALIDIRCKLKGVKG